ncbi:MAG: hypothetical protein CMF55_04190 [Legionellales bacterium]|nr:hypothetical protein [Legionellales bacterium]
MINNKVIQNILTLFISIMITSPLLVSVVNGMHLLVFTSIMLFFIAINPKLSDMHLSTRSLVFISTSILSALLTWMVESIRSAIWGVTEPYFIYSFAISFIIGSSGYFIDQVTAKSLPIKKISIYISIILLIMALSSVFLKGSQLDHKFPIIDSPILMGGSMGFFVGSFLCLLVFELILPSLYFFRYLSEYMRVLVIPASAFFIGYIIITIMFSGIYAYSQAVFGHQFVATNSNGIAFNDYLYYSFISITALGDGNITPIAVISRWLTILEVMLGIIWMTIVLAATLGYAQEKFNEISIRHKDRL